MLVQILVFFLLVLVHTYFLSVISLFCKFEQYKEAATWAWRWEIGFSRLQNISQHRVRPLSDGVVVVFAHLEH